MSRLRLDLDLSLSQAQLENTFVRTTKQAQLQQLESFLHELACGCASGSLSILCAGGDGTKASATLTVSDVISSTVTINGTTLTGGTDYALVDEDMDPLTTDEVAANIAAAINSSTDPYMQLVSAESDEDEVLVSSREVGLQGNMFTISATDDVAASGTNLTGGEDATPTTFSF